MFKTAIVKIYLYLKLAILKILNFLLFNHAIRKDAYKKIIVLKSGGLGDFLMGVPALNLIKKTYGSADIVLVTNTTFSGMSIKKYWTKSAPASDSTGENLEWLPFVEKKINRFLRLQSLTRSEIARLRSEIGPMQNTAVVVLCYPGVPLSSLLKRIIFVRVLTGGNVSLFGVNKCADYSVLRRYQAISGLFKHKALGDLDSAGELCSTLGYEGNLTCDLYVASAAKKKMSDFIECVARNGQKLVLVAPIAARAYKQWPITNYGKVMCQIADRLRGDVFFILIGTRNDHLAANELLSHSPAGTRNLCGMLSLSEIAALLMESSLFLGNDGGMAHLAGALSVRSVVVFNSVEEHGLTTPMSEKSVVVRVDVACSPCYNEVECPLGHRACVVNIPVEKVLSACALI